MARKLGRLEHVSSCAANGQTVIINGVLEVPFCADSGADNNIIFQAMVQALGTLDNTVVLVPPKPPVMVKVGGTIMSCCDRIYVDLQIETAAGPLNIAQGSCLVLDGDEEDFLLGRATLKDIVIDVNGCSSNLLRIYSG